MAQLPIAKEGKKVITFMTTVAIEECVRINIFEFAKGVTLKGLATTEYHALVVYLVFRTGRWVVEKITGRKDLTTAEVAGAIVIGSIVAPFAATGLLISAVIDALLPSSNSESSNSYDSDSDNDYSPGSWNSYFTDPRF